VDYAPKISRLARAKVSILFLIHLIAVSCNCKLCQKKRKGIFSNFAVMLGGCFPAPGPPKSALAGLVTVGDGVILKSTEELLNTLNDRVVKKSFGYRVVVVCHDKAAMIELRDQIKERWNDCNLNAHPIVFALPLWIMDSVSNVAAQNITDSKYSIS